MPEILTAVAITPRQDGCPAARRCSRLEPKCSRAERQSHAPGSYNPPIQPGFRSDDGLEHDRTQAAGEDARNHPERPSEIQAQSWP
jgi:hypothetical protein